MATNTRVASRHMFTGDLKRFMGNSRLYPFMEYHSLDVVHLVRDDFTGLTLDTGDYTLGNGGGTSVASPVITAGVANGVADFVTGTSGDSTASSQIATGLQAYGDHGCVFVCCLTILTAITNVKVEVGFTDALNDAGAVNAKATPTFNAADCALWVYDTSDNAYWEGLGANNTSTAPMANLEAGISPVADTYEWVMVELNENDTTSHQCAVTFRRFTAAGELTYEAVTGKTDNQGPNGNVLLTPWIYVEARSATSKTLRVDYMGAWQHRTAI